MKTVRTTYHCTDKLYLGVATPATRWTIAVVVTPVGPTIDTALLTVCGVRQQRYPQQE
jgi:hypothetical protein